MNTEWTSQTTSAVLFPCLFVLVWFDFIVGGADGRVNMEGLGGEQNWGI